MDEGYFLIIRPPIDEPEKMIDLFQAKQFDDYSKLYLYNDRCVLCFKSYSRANAFIDYFDGYRIGPVRISVTMERFDDRIDHPMERNLRPRSPPRLPRFHSKTVHVKNYPIEELTDRNIWNDFRTSGFIRQIETRGSTAYIQYDTEEDAVNAIKKMNGIHILGKKILVELIPDRILNLPNVVVPLIITDKPKEAREKTPT
ncbi:hypothetical protein TRFO_17526 [Tritrichomonas foetus]|uniref:RRM domain-containing protein n=1 Tax=Tritrichomonas foetus TaxID=1144522 RepID=A0A1J4KMX8_9EUKA|nr:hypothetical protein TRFO_17526 [Tritrichomonas foetus]|eukprot:OHT12679.1 hypothetical protein TRFO_17526 [Tritrichomonas foetus]